MLTYESWCFGHCVENSMCDVCALACKLYPLSLVGWYYEYCLPKVAGVTRWHELEASCEVRTVVNIIWQREMMVGLQQGWGRLLIHKQLDRKPNFPIEICYKCYIAPIYFSYSIQNPSLFVLTYHFEQLQERDAVTQRKHVSIWSGSWGSLFLEATFTCYFTKPPGRNCLWLWSGWSRGQYSWHIPRGIWLFFYPPLSTPHR